MSVSQPKTCCASGYYGGYQRFRIYWDSIKVERPGKGTVVTPCDTIDGPYVEFNDGSARRIQDSSDLELIFLMK